MEEKRATSEKWSTPIAVLKRVAAPAVSALPRPRLLVVLAHPDDEVLAMGARLERLAHSRLLTITDGAPANGADALAHGFATLEAYRTARMDELAAALANAGVSLETISPALDTSPVPVPDQTAALHLAAITRLIAEAIVAFAPEAVLTHPYEGGHPDHDACAFAVHTAVRLLQERAVAALRASEPDGAIPVVIEAPSYHAGDDGSMRTGLFLDVATPREMSEQIISCALTPEEQANKRRRLACFHSQAETLAQFATQQELFRVAPAYDFTLPPHPGQLFYERFPWGMSGERFRVFAADACEDLRASFAVRIEQQVQPSASGRTQL